jgi:hypothetical protein
VLILDTSAVPAAEADWSQPPFMLKVGGVPFDIGNPQLGGYSPEINGIIGGDAYGQLLRALSPLS